MYWRPKKDWITPDEQDLPDWRAEQIFEFGADAMPEAMKKELEKCTDTQSKIFTLYSILKSIDNE